MASDLGNHSLESVQVHRLNGWPEPDRSNSIGIGTGEIDCPLWDCPFRTLTSGVLLHFGGNR